MSTDASGERKIVTAEGEVRDYKVRRPFTVVENGKWSKGLWQWSLDRLKTIAVVVTSLGVLGSALMWTFTEKVEMAVSRKIDQKFDEKVVPLANSHAKLNEEFDQHILESLRLQNAYVSKEELRDDLESIEEQLIALRKDLQIQRDRDRR